jgi:hypothetical protein
MNNIKTKIKKKNYNNHKSNISLQFNLIKMDHWFQLQIIKI